MTPGISIFTLRYSLGCSGEVVAEFVVDKRLLLQPVRIDISVPDMNAGGNIRTTNFYSLEEGREKWKALKEQGYRHTASQVIS